MESLLYSIALRYGKGKITDIGLNYAAKLLGIDQQEQNPKYTYGMPFTNGAISFNPINMLKTGALNKGIKSLIGGGSLLTPYALGAGAIYLLNKNREKFTGYDTQQAYEDAREKRIADKRLDKITDRIVNDKNYGNYEDAILGSGAGAIKIDDKVMYQTDYFPEPPKKKAYRDQPNIHSDNNNNNDNGSGNFASQNTGTNENFSNTTGKGRTGYVRGGIASL